MGFRVAITNPRYDNLDLEREALDPIGAELIPVYAEDDVSYAEQIADMDAVIVGPRVSPTGEVIAQLRSIKIIQATGIGVDKIDVDAATAAGIPVVNVPDVFTEEVADQAFTLLLGVNRKLIYTQQMAASGAGTRRKPGWARCRRSTARPWGWWRLATSPRQLRGGHRASG